MRLRRRRKARRTVLRAALERAGAALAAPLAWAADRMLAPPLLHHAIAAERTVLRSRCTGRISVYEHRTAPGIPLVLLHDVGPAGSAYELRALFDAFRGERPVLAPDLPGYGFSERRPGAYVQETFVAFVCELLADVSRRYGSAVDVVAVGRTAGIAARAVRPVARFVRSLVVVGPRAAAPQAWMRRAALERLFARPLVGALVHRVATSKPMLSLALATRAAQVDPNLVAYANEAARRPGARHAALAALAGALDADPRPVLEALRVPFLEIPGAMPHVDRPEETVTAMRSFYGGLAPKPQLRLIRGEGHATPRRKHVLGRAR